jgi:hypothetical protein
MRNRSAFVKHTLDGGAWPALDGAGVLAAQFALGAFAAPIPIRCSNETE